MNIVQKYNKLIIIGLFLFLTSPTKASEEKGEASDTPSTSAPISRYSADVESIIEGTDFPMYGPQLPTLEELLEMKIKELQDTLFMRKAKMIQDGAPGISGNRNGLSENFSDDKRWDYKEKIPSTVKGAYQGADFWLQDKRDLELEQRFLQDEADAQLSAALQDEAAEQVLQAQEEKVKKEKGFFDRLKDEWLKEAFEKATVPAEVREFKKKKEEEHSADSSSSSETSREEDSTDSSYSADSSEAHAESQEYNVSADESDRIDEITESYGYNDF